MFKRAGVASEEGWMPSENEAEILCLPHKKVYGYFKYVQKSDIFEINR
jgi:hypothetical protein